MLIATRNLVLRDFSRDDLDAYQALRADDKFQRFYSEKDSANVRAHELIELFVEQSKKIPRTQFQLAITLQIEVLIGSCGVRLENANIASVGCDLGTRWHGRGFAREAGIAMIGFAFRNLMVDKIYAETISDNLAALRLCRMMGMRPALSYKDECVFKGRVWRMVRMEVTRQEWVGSVA